MQQPHDTAGAASPAKSLTETRRAAVTGLFGERFLETFPQAISFIDNVTLESPEAQRFYKKDFAYLSTNLNREYQYRGWSGFNVEMLDRFESIITTKMTNIRQLFTNNINRIRNIMAANRLDDETTFFASTLTVTVPIISGHARGYFMLLKDLDTVITLAGAANMQGAISSSQRVEIEYTSKRALRHFRTIIQTEVVRLWREADRVMAQQNSQGKQVSKEIAAIVAAHAKGIKDMEETTKADNENDGHAEVSSDEAAQQLDNALATSNAAVAATSPKTRRKSSASRTEPQAAA